MFSTTDIGPLRFLCHRLNDYYRYEMRYKGVYFTEFKSYWSDHPLKEVIEKMYTRLLFDHYNSKSTSNFNMTSLGHDLCALYFSIFNTDLVSFVAKDTKQRCFLFDTSRELSTFYSEKLNGQVVAYILKEHSGYNLVLTYTCRNPRSIYKRFYTLEPNPDFLESEIIREVKEGKYQDFITIINLF